jgi:putative oxidoreductase
MNRVSSCGLLLLRSSIGLFLLLGHGLPKLLHFGARAAAFPDPLHVGHAASLALTVFSEVLCAAGLVVGLLTRPAAVAIAVQMLVAVALVHTHDPWAKKEMALLYAVPSLTLVLTGAGDWSLDALIARWRARR